MRLNTKLYLLLPLSWALIFLTLSPSKAPLCSRLEVTQVLDGDTVVDKNYGSIRLLYIDAPELDQKAFSGELIGRLSLNFISQQLKQKKTKRLCLVKKDLYGRWLGEIFLNDQSLSFLMIRKGFAPLYPFARFPHLEMKRSYLKAQFLARKHRLGLWKVEGFYSPKKWRSLKRKKLRR